jgi:hypothetical protein
LSEEAVELAASAGLGAIPVLTDSVHLYRPYPRQRARVQQPQRLQCPQPVSENQSALHVESKPATDELLSPWKAGLQIKAGAPVSKNSGAALNAYDRVLLDVESRSSDSGPIFADPGQQ